MSQGYIHWDSNLWYNMLSHHQSSPFLLKLLEKNVLQSSVSLGQGRGEVEGCEVWQDPGRQQMCRRKDTHDVSMPTNRSLWGVYKTCPQMRSYYS